MKQISNMHVLWGMAALKLVIHLFTNTNYGLHRDEYLYIAEGIHLGWGYMEGPPVIGLIAAVGHVLGGSPFVFRLLPALAGTAVLFIIGKIVIDLGGKTWSVFFTSLAFLVSPAFLRTNLLFQPVSFNQLIWVVLLATSIYAFKHNRLRYWNWVGLAAGIGLMTKYSVLLLLFSLFIGTLVSKRTRKVYLTRGPYIAAFIALIIFLPNLIWQIQHNFPVAAHMRALASSQLAHVRPFSYLSDQLLMHIAGSLVWISGLLFLMISDLARQWRFIGWTYIILTVLLLILGGKSYYSLGIYPLLFVFGGLALEKWITPWRIRTFIAAFIIATNLPFTPYALPVLSLEKLEKYCQFMSDQVNLNGPITWEDGRKRSIPQDYADMHGWEEIVQKTSRFYHSLPDSVKGTCHIWGGSYGHAGALNFYAKKYGLPEAHSFNASFLIWCPDENDFQSQILVDDVKHDSSTWFHDMTLVDSLTIPLARDPGYIYFRKEPISPINEVWREVVKNAKSTYNF
jgi:hypothetical protein